MSIKNLYFGILTLTFLLGNTLYSSSIKAQTQKSSLTVEKIMRDPKWIGQAPENIYWDFTSQNVYFSWNPKNEDFTSLYKITPKNFDPVQVNSAEKTQIQQFVSFDKEKKNYLYTKNGDIFLVNVKSGKKEQLTKTAAEENNPRFGPHGHSIIFNSNNNIFELSLIDNSLKQLVNFTQNNTAGVLNLNLSGRNLGQTLGNRAQNDWLRNDQLGLFEVLKEEKRMDSIRRARSMKDQKDIPSKNSEIPIKTISIDKGSLGNVEISPNLRFITYKITFPPANNSNTIVPNYVTESGYTEQITGRTKVGNNLSSSITYILDRNTNKLYEINTSNIPGIKDLPDYWDDYPEKKAALLAKNENRSVNIQGVFWNDSGNHAFVVIHSADNKDRWIMRLAPESGNLTLIDRQRDEAWIGGPGLGSKSMGWLDDENIFFQSETSGYAHIYTANILTGVKKQLTSGNWEVRNLQLSNDKKQFYFIGNKEHPGITHFYKLPTHGGDLIQLTTMKGGNEVTLSPDEKWLAIRHSYSNKPWELFVQENKAGAKPIKITESTSSEFNAYPWRDPQLITFKNRHGDDIYARLYQPENPKPNKPAVIFVHGAGYLQNVHYWWSQYFREYMFHNLLTDLGYTVLDIDYTASSGYGRDHRTGIYRHMGGKDLSDQVDGASLLVEKYNINPKNIGIYGGSYGGFITLMALFNEPKVFAAGAALRSVTDWAHYNHGYTANILNEPYNDPLAYKRSSPIYFAEGLQGHLLMCHGMLDVNVHFQDIVRLSQRLIEIGKDNWELAVYPIEDHGFVTASGWTDEYKRILKLFEERLNN